MTDNASHRTASAGFRQVGPDLLEGFTEEELTNFLEPVLSQPYQLSVEDVQQKIIDALLDAKTVKSLEQVQSFLFPKYLNPCPSDKAIVERAYIAQLLKSAVTHSSTLISQRLFDNDQEYATKWVLKSDSITSVEELCQLLDGREPFVKNLRRHSSLIGADDEKKLVAKIKSIFWKLFDAASTLQGEVEAYRTLKRCVEHGNYSKMFCEAAKKLIAFVCGQDSCIDPPVESQKETNDHVLFELGVRKLIENGKKEFVLKEKFIENFEITRVILKELADRWVVLVTGRKYRLSVVLQNINDKLATGDVDVDEIHLTASREVTIDTDATWHGKTVVIIANSVQLTGKHTIDLSGNPPLLEPKLQDAAKSGQQVGDDGENGEDGSAGGFSGHFQIHTNEMTKPEHLTVLLNGTDGNPGQEGGRGADGKDGFGLKYSGLEEAMSGFVSGVCAPLLSTLVLPAMFMKADARYIDKTLDNGLHQICSACSYYASVHKLYYFQGTKGAKGGRGGHGGFGGEGGHEGSSQAISLLTDAPFPINVVSIKGNDGANGKDGSCGEWGKDGWDVAASLKSFEMWKGYGQNNNEKLDLDFYNAYKSTRIYVATRYNRDGYGYAEVIRRPNERRQIEEHERQVEVKAASSRKGKSIAQRKKAVDKWSVSQYYSLLNEEETKMEEQIVEESETSEEIQIGRLATYVPPVSLEHSEKSRIVRPAYAAVVTRLQRNPQKTELWTELMATDINAEKLCELEACLMQHVQSGEIKTRFKQKLILHKIRNEAKTVKGFASRIRHLMFMNKSNSGKKKDLLASVAKQILIGQVQRQEADCSRYLKVSNGNFQGVSKFMDILIGLDDPKSIVDEAWEALLKQRTDLEKFELATDLLDKWSQLTIGRKQISEIRITELIDSLQNGMPYTKEIAENKLVDLNQRTTATELAAIEKTFDKKEAAKALGEGTFAWMKHKAKEYSGFDKLVQLAKNNKINQLLFRYAQVEQVVAANDTINTLMCAFFATNASEQFLEENSVNLASDVDWLKLSQDAKVMGPCKEFLLNSAMKSQAYRALLAWQTKTNLRVYTREKLVENHNPLCRNTEHVLLDEKTGELKILEFDVALVELLQGRASDVNAFGQQIFEMDQEIMPQAGHLQLYPVPNKSLLAELVGYIPSSATILRSLTVLGCDEMITSALCTSFRSEGCWIDEEDLEFFAKVIFDAYVQYGQTATYYTYLLYRFPQEQWLDEFLIASIENHIHENVTDKHFYRTLLMKVPDSRLKMLLGRKLSTESRLMQKELISLLHCLKRLFGASKELEKVPILDWVATLGEAHLFFVLNGKKSNLRDSDKRFLLFHCTKLSDVCKNRLEIEKLFEALAKDEQIYMPLKELALIMNRVYSKELLLNEETIQAILKSQQIYKASLEDHMRGKKCNIEEFGDNTRKSDFENKDYDGLQMSGSERKLEQVLEFMHDKTDVIQKCSELLRAFPNEQLRFEKKNGAEVASEWLGRNPHIDTDLALLHTVDWAVFQLRHFHLRANQRLAVLLALKCQHGRNYLEQISTGEGKSLIIACLAIVKVLKSERVDILTSSSTLAKRDTESEPPKGCSDLYELFGIHAGHICVNHMAARRAVYNKCQVVYGDLASFQRDHLLDAFYNMNIIGDRRATTLIVDEVDSMVLDQGNNMLYLSHEVAELEELQSLLVRIWHCVSRPPMGGDIQASFDTEFIMREIRHCLMPVLEKDELAELLEISQAETRKIWANLLQEKLIETDGKILIKEFDKSQLTEKITNVDTKIKERLLYILETILSQGAGLGVPEHLVSFVLRHLRSFIENAKVALFMEEGDGYQVDVTASQSTIQLSPQIIIVDQSTGSDLPTTQWHDGLHQFLQLKHGCRMTPISLKAVFISNVTYINRYEYLYGFSGTLGSKEERELLGQLYKVDCVTIPSAKPKLFYEECTEIASTYDGWVKSMYAAIKHQLKENRSVLVVCKSVKQVTELSDRVCALAKSDKQIDTIDRQRIEEAHVYKRDYEDFAYGKGNQELESKTVIFATNLAGRGTDIKLEEKLIASGGLHVIVAFLPDNIRIEEQAFGRAARCGEPGTAKIVVFDENGQHSDIFRMKIYRNAQELKRIREISAYYNAKIKLEEDCFKIFAEHFRQCSLQLQRSKEKEEMRTVWQHDLLDQWAFWIDEHTIANIPREEVIAKTTHHVSTLSVLKELQSPTHILQRGLHFAVEESFETASQEFNRISNHYPYLAAEAKYYQAYLTIKTCPKRNDQITSEDHLKYREISGLLKEAKREFQVRQQRYNNDRGIVESYKRTDQNRIIKVEAFAKQQEQRCQLLGLFIQSIEGILGAHVDHSAFKSQLVTEEIAYSYYNALIEHQVLTQPMIDKVLSENDVKALCNFYLMHASKTAKALNSIEGKPITSQLISEAIDQPSAEEFWELLKKENVIEKEKRFTYVDEVRLQNIDGALTKLINECYETEAEEMKRNEKKEGKSEKGKETNKGNKGKQAAIEADSVIWLYSRPQKIDPNKICSLQKLSSKLGGMIPVLRSIGIIYDNRSANINKEKVQNQASFPKFATICEDDFKLVNIPGAEILSLIDQLHKAESLEKLGQPCKCCSKSVYSLNKPIDWQNVPICYRGALEPLFKLRFAYAQQYRSIQKAVADGEVTDIKLPSHPEKSFLGDLYEFGIIPMKNVKIKHLDEINIRDDENVLSKIWNTANYTVRSGEGFRQRNLAKIASTVARKYKAVAGSGSNDKFKDIEAETTILAIYQKLFASCGIEKVETLDASLNPTLDEMRKYDLLELQDSANLVVAQGASFIIVIHEKRHSFKMWMKFGGIMTAAAAQLAIGGLILISSCGTGAFAAKFFISEGISDMIFALCGAYSGQIDGYWQNKVMSIAASAVMCGAAWYFSNGTIFNSVGYRLAGLGHSVEGVNLAHLSGKELFAKVKGVYKAAGMIIAKQVGSAIFRVAFHAAAMNALEGLLDAVSNQLRDYVLGEMDKQLHKHKVRETIVAVLQQMGKSDGSQLVAECGAACIRDGSLSGFIEQLCEVLFQRMLPFMQSIGWGVAEGKGFGGAETSWTTYVTWTVRIMTVVQAAATVYCLTDKCSAFLDEIDTLLSEKLKKAAERRQSVNPNTDKQSKAEINKKDAAKIRDNLMEPWREKIRELAKIAIQRQVISPLMHMATAHVAQQIENFASTCYSKLRAHLDNKQLEKRKQKYDEERKRSPAKEAELQEKYFSELNELAKKTRSPEVLAAIIAEGVKIDTTSAAAITPLLSALCGRFAGADVKVIVSSATGEEYEHGSATDEKNTVRIHLENGHYTIQSTGPNGAVTTSISSGKNACLYDALIAEFPELKTVFSDDQAFRKGLASVLVTDPYCRHHIEQGWHAYSYERELLGGAIKGEDQKAVSDGVIENNRKRQRIDVRQYTICTDDNVLMPAVRLLEECVDPNDIRSILEVNYMLDRRMAVNTWEVSTDPDRRTHVGKDSQGRIIYHTSTIDPDNLSKGTSVPTHVRRNIVTQGDRSRQAGHIDAKCLGGLGNGDMNNLFSQNSVENQGYNAAFEKKMKTFLEENPDHRIIRTTTFEFNNNLLSQQTNLNQRSDFFNVPTHYQHHFQFFNAGHRVNIVHFGFNNSGRRPFL